MTVLFQVLPETFGKDPLSSSVDDGDLFQSGYIGVIDVFIHVHPGAVQVLPLNVQRHRDGLALRLVDLPLAGPGGLPDLGLLAVHDQHDIIQPDVDLHDSHLDLQFAPVIGQGKDLAVLVQREYPNQIAYPQL